MQQRWTAAVSLFSFILHPSSFILLLVSLCYLLFVHGLADRDLWSSHEARAAQDAESIRSNGEWGVPQLFDRHVELQKPPLYYWCVALIARVRGGSVDAWAVRLPAACAAFLGVLGVFLLGVQRGRTLAGGIAALTMATALHYTWLARVGRIDMPLMLTTGICLGAFYLSDRCRRDQGGKATHGYLLIAYLGAALAVLFKGPIGLVLPAAVIVVHVIVEAGFRAAHGESGSTAAYFVHGSLGMANRFGIWWGLPLVLSLTLPWYLWINAHTEGQYFHVFFWKHNLERGLGGGTLQAHPWWFYGPRLFFDWLPWSPLFVLFAHLLIRRKWWRDDPEARFGAVWLLTILFVLSCSRFKRADYLLPAYPGAALFLGSVATRWYEQTRYRRAVQVAFAGVIMGMPLAWQCYLGTVVAEQDSRLALRRFAEEVRRHSPVPQLVLFFRVEEHALAFHVGRPLDTILEWENLDVWAGRPEVYHVVMPAECARDWRRHLHRGRLERVALPSAAFGNGTRARPLVLMRTHPGADPPQG